MSQESSNNTSSYREDKNYHRHEKKSRDRGDGKSRERDYDTKEYSRKDRNYHRSDRDKYKYDRNNHSRRDRDRERDRDRNYDRKYRERYRRSHSRSRSSSHERRRSKKYPHSRSRSRTCSTSKEHKPQNTIFDNIDHIRSPPRRIEKYNTFSAEKLQSTYEKYENDPNFDITDGLLDDIVIDKEKIHMEMQERLRQHLAAEGKIYPPPKPQQSQTMFANDGSFLEMFKKMQEQQPYSIQPSTSEPKIEDKKTPVPIYGKRRGGKILKTGIVQKRRPTEENMPDALAKDAWSLYMQEVKKYKNVSCDMESKTRPLVK